MMEPVDPPKQARLAILRLAVKKVPFSSEDIRREAPDAGATTVKGQIKRLRLEGVITRISAGFYIATCVAHLASSFDTKKEKTIPQADEIVSFLETPRRANEVQEHFELSCGVCRSRLNALIEQGRAHKHKFRDQQLYAASLVTLRKMITSAAKPTSALNRSTPRFGGVSRIAETVMRHQHHA
jgi:hypothetical protein